MTTDFINVEYFNPIITPDPIDLFKCSSGLANYTFDLSINTPIVSIPGTQISYHLSLANANSKINSLPNNYTTVTSNLPTPIWIRIEDMATNCFITKSFQLRLTLPPIANPVGDISSCETITGSNTSFFDIGSQTASILGGQSATIYNVSYYWNQSNRHFKSD